MTTQLVFLSYINLTNSHFPGGFTCVSEFKEVRQKDTTGRTGHRGPHPAQQDLLQLIPCLSIRKKGGVLGFLHVGPQLCLGPELHMATVASALVNLPSDEVDQLHLLIEI